MLIHSCTKTVKKAPCTLIQNLRFIFLIWDLNQGNPSIKIAMEASGQGRSCISFFMPFATHLQPFATRAVWYGKKPVF